MAARRVCQEACPAMVDDRRSVLGDVPAAILVAGQTDRQLVAGAAGQFHAGLDTLDPSALARRLLLVAAPPQAMNFRLPRVAVDHPDLGDADLAVEIKLVVRLVTGAVNLHNHVGSPLEVLVAVD